MRLAQNKCKGRMQCKKGCGGWERQRTVHARVVSSKREGWMDCEAGCEGQRLLGCCVAADVAAFAKLGEIARRAGRKAERKKGRDQCVASQKGMAACCGH